MTSFFAQSFEFFSDKPESVCAFLTTTRPIFNSSVIPVTLNRSDLWNALSSMTNRNQQPLLRIFLLSDTLQFSPSLMLISDNYLSDPFFLKHLLETLIHKRRYFCRTLKHFKTDNFAALELICEHVPSLETLDYSYNRISYYDYRTRETRRPITRLTRLRVLNVNKSLVTDDDLQHFSGLTSLEKLSFFHTRGIMGHGFTHLSGMKSLRVLELFGLRELSESGLLCLPELPSLVELSLTRNVCVTDAGFRAIEKQKNLRILNLNGCYKVSSEGLEGLRELPDLADLDLSGCHRIDDNSLSVLASIEGSLLRLSLAYSSLISDQGLTTLVNEMKDLVFLDLSGCSKITDTSLKAISNLKYLTELRIDYLPLLSDEGIHFLKNCPQLSTIFFGSQNYAITCSVTDLSLEILSQMKSLTHLVLYNLKTLTDNGVAKLADSESLERFELHEANDVTNDAMLSLSKSNSLRRIKIPYYNGSQVTKAALSFFEGTKIHVEIEIDE